MLIHILRYKLLSYIKSTFDRKPSSIVRGIASLLVFGGFAYTAYLFSAEVTRYMLAHAHTGLYLFHTFVSMILFVFFVAVNLGNIIVSYSTLYRSMEVRFLLTKPISFTSIFILKFLDNFFYSSTTLFLGAFMMFLGYGSYFNYPLHFLVVIMLFVFVPFMFLSASLAGLILMAIMKLAGKIGFKKVLAGIFIIYLFFVYIFFEKSNPTMLVENLNRFIPDIDAYISQMVPGFLHYLPNQWVAEFLYYSARGDMAHALPYAGILITVTAVVFGACLFVAHRFYYKSWLISLQVQPSAEISHRRRHIFDFRSKSIFSPQVEVLLKKEILTFLRETSQWVHLLVMVALAGIFSVSASHINLMRARVIDLHMIIYLVLFTFGGFMISGLALRFVFPMIGLEGQAFWSLKTSPVKQSKIFQLKFIMGFLLILIVAEYITISSSVPFIRATGGSRMLIWFGVFNAFWISFTTVMLSLGFGGYFANYFEHNPIRAASTQGATLTFLITIIYLILIVIVIIVPVSALFSKGITDRYSSEALITLPGALLAFVSGVLSVFGWIIGQRSLKKDF
ncbi:MAG: hypothetical protein JXA06_08435 [Bacteroidetes bacterium]|nr:hypothetical protein [Bacteroidota bacterium]